VTLVALAGCGGGGDDDGLVVSAAASLQTALTECTKDDDVRLSFGGSDELAAQIRMGVRPGVYAAANTRLPDELAGEGLLEQPVAFATNQLVLAVPAGSRIRQIEDLDETGLRLVVGSESVPVGAYTREVLARLPADRARRIEANIRSEEPDVKGIVGKLLQGAADAGFVYRTDVRAAGDELTPIGLPADLEPEVAYGAGVVKGAGEDARRFVDGLLDGECARALRDAGFGSPR
jgi:molybdate transport system substrate-binding protein